MVGPAFNRGERADGERRGLCGVPPASSPHNHCPTLVRTQLQMAAKTKGSGDAVLRVAVERKASVWGYQGGVQKDFIRIDMSLPNHVSAARSERGGGRRGRGGVFVWMQF